MGKEFAQAVFQVTQKPGHCVGVPIGCGMPIEEGFRDTASRREYDISGLCQSCQDSVFFERFDEEPFEEDYDYGEELHD